MGQPIEHFLDMQPGKMYVMTCKESWPYRLLDGSWSYLEKGDMFLVLHHEPDKTYGLALYHSVKILFKDSVCHIEYAAKPSNRSNLGLAEP